MLPTNLHFSFTEQTVEELKVTRKKTEDKLEREVPLLPFSGLSEDGKYVKAIRKKLNSIANLIKQQESGVQLDEQQLTKIARCQELIVELERFKE